MKKLIIIASILFLAVIFVTPVSVSANSVNPGIKPGSIFYFFDTAFEKINLFFTFNSEKKVEKALEYADERLAEAEAVANENKPESVEKVMENYQEKISLATEKSKEIKDEEKAKELLSTISENTSKHQETLTEVYNKVPDEAKQAVERALSTSMKAQEQANEQIAELKTEIKELKQQIVELEQSQIETKDQQIEDLRREVDALKQQAIPKTQSAPLSKPQIVEKVAERITEVPPSTPSKNIKTLSKTEIFEKVSSAVVLITTTFGSGSGMIIESDGVILTNAHVVEDVNRARVKLHNGNIAVASVIGRDENVDLAILEINNSNLPIVELGNSDIDSLKIGDDLFAFGFPLDFSHTVTVTRGILSARQNLDGVFFLQTDASIHPGNSGGPLVNNKGEIIGINTAGVVAEGIRERIGGTGIGFAIPINVARGLLPELKTGRNIIKPPKIVIPQPIIPEPIPTPTPTPTPIPVPTCTEDTWKCYDWSECSSSGSQTRTCYKTFDCSVISTPSPKTTQSCTPPPPPEPTSEEFLDRQNAHDFRNIYITENDTSVSIKWRTAEETYVKIKYDINSLNHWDQSSIKIVEDSPYVLKKFHEVSISGLVPGTTHAFRVIVIDRDGNKKEIPADLSTLHFKTTGSPPVEQDTTPPTIERTKVKDITNNSATLEWSTDMHRPATSRLEYGTDENFASAQTVYLNDLSYDHFHSLTHLEPATTYYYRILITNKSGYKAHDPTKGSFVTLSE